MVEWSRGGVTDQELSGEMPMECKEELRATELTECGLLSSESSGVSKIIDIQRYSSYGQLIVVTAYVLRFIERMRVRGCETFKELAVLMEKQRSFG